MSNKDYLILEVEKWLNANYSDYPGFGYLEPEGRPGNTVVGRLIMALQIELGIVNIVPNFGPGTESAFQNINREQFNEEKSYNLVYILQGAFWAKGYSPGTFDGRFNAQTENAILRFQSDVGFEQPDGVVDAKLMKALLNTDGFRLNYNGKPMIRIIQQVLNTEYAEGFFDYIPTNGIYERQTNKALIYAFQIEIGIGYIANGNYGPSTIGNTPTLRPGNSQKGVNKILEFALTVNGAPNLVLNGDYDDTVEWAVREFQAFMTLPVTGIADMPTIKQLLTSNGYIGRPARACDASMIINYDRARTLKENGYEVIGRYLTGTVGWERRPKAMTHAELAILKEQGIRVFPIYQDGGVGTNYFNKNQGQFDAEIAVNKAFELGFPEGTTIYFAVDYDAYDYQITSNIIPYMNAIKQFFNQLEHDPSMPTYHVGVYGPRNVCIRCQNELNVSYSFVSNMSTGFSGNLGFPMPENWSFGQFFETSIGSGAGYLEIDKNDYSGRDTGAIEFTPQKVADRKPEEEAVFQEWKDLIKNVPLLSDYYFLISPQFEFNQTYVLVDTFIHRIEASASAVYTHLGELEGLTFNVVDGEIEGSIEENLGEDRSVLSSYGISLIEKSLTSVAVGVDNGRIAVSLEIKGDELYCHLDLYNEDIETELDTLNLVSRVTLVVKLNPLDFSKEQIDTIQNLARNATYALALILLFGVVANISVPALIALLTEAFLTFN